MLDEAKFHIPIPLTFFFKGRGENFISVEYILYMITGKSMEHKTENTFALYVTYILQL